MYDVKIPLEKRASVLIERNRLKRNVSKKQITVKQAERFLAAYIIQEGDVIAGKESANKDVLLFINKFLNNSDDIWKTFTSGYCYYFAVILKEAFQRGDICWCAPFGHICWLDENGVPYDIGGVCDSECDFYIPVRYIQKGLDDIKHVPNKAYNAPEEYIEKAIQAFWQDVISNLD